MKKWCCRVRMVRLACNIAYSGNHLKGEQTDTRGNTWDRGGAKANGDPGVSALPRRVRQTHRSRGNQRHPSSSQLGRPRAARRLDRLCDQCAANHCKVGVEQNTAMSITSTLAQGVNMRCPRFPTTYPLLVTELNSAAETKTGAPLI